MSKIGHPEDTTNDILLWLETLLRQFSHTSDDMIQIIEDAMIVIMRLSKETQIQQKYEHIQKILNQARQQETNLDDIIDKDLEKQLLLL